jgi:hypothetical protein
MPEAFRVLYQNKCETCCTSLTFIVRKYHTIGVLFVIENSVSVGPGWGSILMALWFCEGRAGATQVLSEARKVTNSGI